MTTIKNWTAKRSGGRITITGTTDEIDQGKPIRVPNVDTIAHVGATSKTVATDKDGNKFTLL